MTVRDLSDPIVAADDALTAVPVALSISPARVVRTLAAAVTFLLIAHFVVTYAMYQFGHSNMFGLVRQFDTLREANIPTWYSSSALLACAALLAAIAGAERATGGRFTRHWTGLALVFVFLSLDETAMVHENVQAQLRRGVDRSAPFFRLASIVFSSLIALVALVASARFLAALPRRTATLFVAAGALFVGGAVGIDYIGELHKGSSGIHNLTYATATGVEEAFEMFGVILFLYALLDYVRMRMWRVTITVARHGTPRGAVRHAGTQPPARRAGARAPRPSVP